MPDNRAYPRGDGDSSAAGQTPERSNAPKRRKIRKGTQSCWECKRRKIRCTFAAPTDTICDGCKSRRTKCISQEYHDDAALASRRVDRLSRVESLVEQLVNRSTADMPDMSRQDHPDQDKNTPVSVANPSPDLESQITSIDDLSSALLAAWPSQHDLDLILNISVSVSVLFHGVICQSYSRFFSGQAASPRCMLQPPSRRTHPVLIARKLLLLASFLQGIPPCSIGDLTGMSSNYHGIMSRAFNATTRLVTSNDELTTSLEGIECIMIESMYLNNAGSLRRAWLINRRAITTAQMMGLHTGASSPTRMILENETLDRIDPNYMWFRLVLSDRYLSLMLGLPQGSPENTFPNLEAPDSCMAVEHLERIESAAASLILQRNSAERTDLAATHKIDKMLQDAAALMPPQWWLMTPDLTAIAGSDVKAFEESVRLTNQFTYHHLLVQLHLPYMMLTSSADSSYDYSKMTAAGASRTIISQYVSFRNSFLATAYCRGIDFIAFIASTTLCLAHIEACRQHRADTGKGVTVFQSLQHQRLSDRGLLERTLEAMETMAQKHHDVVAKKISSILRPLLAIENNSFRGDCYHVYASPEAEKQESQSLGDTTEAFHALHIQIPYFGTIQIEHRPILPDTIRPLQAISEGETASTARRAGYEISATQPANTDWQTVSSSFESGPTNGDQMPLSFNTNGAQETYLLIPGLSADVEDWALQGVDMALFSNLTHGSMD
ncbi:hypothetical protein Hte_011834 [Hypoxylon texense]